MMKKTIVLTALVASAIAYKSSGSSAEVATETFTIDAETTCLAKNMYFEAKGQPKAGQIAVSLVVMNRVKDSRFPNTICEVVYQGPTSKWWKEEHDKDVPIRNKCQFSWFCDGKSDEIRDVYAYSGLYLLATRVIDGRYDGMLEGSTHYHATYVNPYWAKTKTYIAQIGDHIFYRWD